jgi:hypothetical protein
MKFRNLALVSSLFALAGLPSRAVAHQNNSSAAPQQSSATASSVPQIIQFSGQFSGIAKDGATPVPSGTVSITFTLYEEEQGGTALWSETQNVQVDAQGHYTALLGSASSEGLPLSLFTTVQAHWLAVQPALDGFAEQPRVLLVSAPYALKAGDAATIGGLPPSAFVMRTDVSPGASGTIAGISAGTTTTVATTTQASKGSAHAKPGRLNTTECGTFCDATTGYQIGGLPVVQMPGGSVDGNIALGYQALFSNAGLANTATGASALFYNTANNNTANGYNALYSNTSGGSNTASGSEALAVNTTGTNNAASGTSALQSNTTGNYNTASGAAALYSNTTANDNTASGYQALYSNTTGAGDSASGASALQDNTTGNYNTASGYAALFSNATGSNNTASGDYALYHNTANDNTASGYQALFANTTGGANTGSGVGALFANTTGYNNTASGYQALYSNTIGYENTASGFQALYSNTTGNVNTASGYQALYSNTTGWYNTANGISAPYNANAYYNTADGQEALLSDTTGSYNTASGYDTLQNNTTGNLNTALGYFAGGFAGTGSNDTFIGANSGPGISTLTNATAIGAHAIVSASNALVLGGTGANAVSVGIGTATPAATLEVNGTGKFDNTVTFAPGQPFPGTGTITGVTAGTDLTGGGASGAVTLNLDTTQVPTLGAASNVFTGGITASSFTGNGAAVTNVNAALLNGLASSAFQPAGSYASLGANTFSGDQNVTGNLTASGTVTGAVVNATTSFDLGGTAFAFGSSSTDNAFLGFAGNTTTSGMSNTAAGVGALLQNTTGGTNTAIGHAALTSNTTGANNIAIGYNAAITVSAGNSNNIEIGSVGSSADSGTIRIGTKGTQKKFFVAGVEGVSVGSAVPVMIDSATGQLGTVSSSRRYKEDIHDMGDATEGLMRLRPVTFRYKKPFDDGSKPIQYGLIAEEVAKVYPDLVAHSADGQIETVKYQLLDPMLLNEVQRQHAEIRELQERLDKMEAVLASISHGSAIQ